MTNPPDVAGNVRSTRQRLEMTLAEVSSKLDAIGHPLAVPVLSKLERGTRNLTVDDLLALAEVLGVPVTTLLSRSTSSPTAASTVAEWLELHDATTDQIEDLVQLREAFWRPVAALAASSPEARADVAQAIKDLCPEPAPWLTRLNEGN